MKSGYKTIQVDIHAKEVPFASVMEETPADMDEFAKVMKLVQDLSDKEPFKPEWLFNKEMPEEVRMYLRQIFQQRIKGITSSVNVDVEGITDEDLSELSPRYQETVDSYRSRVKSVLSKYEDNE